MTISDEQPFEIGDFVRETLVTDTVIHEIVSKTAKTITIRRCQDATLQDGHTLNAGEWPYIRTAQISNPNGVPHTLRLRKDGTYRIGEYAGVRPLRKANTILFPDGNQYPYRYTDYSF